MKSIAFVIFGCIIAINSLAQKPKVKNDPSHDDRPIHFGFSLGLNTMDFNVRQSKVAVDTHVVVDVARLQPGFQVHAISNLRLGKYFDLRVLPGISFGGERQISYLNLDVNNPVIRDEDNPVRIESNFLEMPVLIKYKSVRVNNFRPFLIGGGNLRFDLAATKKSWGRSSKNNNLVLLNVFDYYYELGFGFDFYLEYFKFAIEFKYSVGLTNVLKKSIKKKSGGDSYYVYPPEADAIYTNAIDRLNSRLFMISFHFE